MRWLLLLAAAGCAGDSQVVGPFTGEVHRYAVDGLTFPTTAAGAQLVADDLDGNGTPDNVFGAIVAFLAGQNDAATHAADMIAAHTITSAIEIQTDDLANGARVGITYLGADGDAAIAIGGAFANGSLHSNRSRNTTVPGEATLVVPVFAESDPSVLELDNFEIDLDPDGSGGFDGFVRGGIPPASVNAAVLTGMRQMLVADPGAHANMARYLDHDHDGVITDAEILFNLIVSDLIQPDLDDGQRLSLAIGIHLTPCASGTCAPVPRDRCADRVRDQDETDVDCGGATCAACAPSLACRVGSDCETGACDQGQCRAASCSDGVRDGFEEDVDCGGLCLGCALDSCNVDADCRTGTCVAGSCAP